MPKYLLMLCLFCFGGIVTAQEATTQHIAQFSPLVITVPADWILEPRGRGEAFRFWTPDYKVFIYPHNQHRLHKDAINANDLGLALKLFPFQRIGSGARSLTAEGWLYQPETIQYEGIDLIVSDFSGSPTPALEMLRLLDNGYMVLMQVEFDEPNPATLDPFYAVMASARMTEVGEFTCTRADFGAAPVYTEADTASAEMTVAADTPVLNYLFTPEAGWFSLQGGGFMRTNDRDEELFDVSGCWQVPFVGERLTPPDPETVELSEVLHLPQGFTMRYPAVDSWHTDDSVSEYTTPWQLRGGVNLQNYILRVNFNIYGIEILDYLEENVTKPRNPYLNCELEQHYEETTVDEQPLVRYTTVATCADEIIYHVYLVVEADADNLLVADMTWVYPRPALPTDTRLVERMLFSVEKRPVGEATCVTTTSQEAALFADHAEKTTTEVLPADTEIELQAYLHDAADEWWVQLISGAWTSNANIRYSPECDLLPILRESGE